MVEITSPDQQIQHIQSKGYWQVRLMPTQPLAEVLTIETCRGTIEKTRVQLRGWDFPHINQKDGFLISYQDFIESFVSFRALNEYWRFYRDGQFIHFFGIESDWYEQTEVLSRLSDGNVKGFEAIAGLYRFTEIFEFASRLAHKSIYPAGLDIEIKLFGTQNRQLYFWDIGRNFHYGHVCRQEPLVVTKRVSSSDLITKSAESALDAYLEILPAFQWTPSREILAEDQKKFLERRIS